jgi:transcriptional regulator with PAS, ATPase and Fis domain
MTGGPWVKKFPAEVMVCDSDGIILAMNNHAEALFADDGGSDLLGRNVLDCHPDPAFKTLEGMLENRSTNCYFNTGHGEKRFIFQSPWYTDGRYSGFVEISFMVPANIPHFIRE